MSKAKLQVHPLVVMTIADHHTRENAGQKQSKFVMGALVGTPDEVQATLPIKYSGNLEFKTEDLDEDLSLYQELKPDHTIVGWYSTAPGLKTGVVQTVTKQFTKWSKNPLYSVLEPVIKKGAIDVPLATHRVTGGKVAAIPWTLKSDASEIAAVDFAVQEADKGQAERLGESISVTKYTQLKLSIQEMMKRIALVQSYLRDIKQAKATPDQEILRDVKTLCNRLPVMNTKDFKLQYRDEQANGQVLTLVTELTEATQNLRRFIDSYVPLCQDGPSGRGGGEPMMGMLGGFGQFF